jgi:hypothetical protein
MFHVLNPKSSIGLPTILGIAIDPTNPGLPDFLAQKKQNWKKVPKWQQKYNIATKYTKIAIKTKWP